MHVVIICGLARYMFYPLFPEAVSEAYDKVKCVGIFGIFAEISGAYELESFLFLRIGKAWFY